MEAFFAAIPGLLFVAWGLFTVISPPSALHIAESLDYIQPGQQLDARTVAILRLCGAIVAIFGVVLAVTLVDIAIS